MSRIVFVFVLFFCTLQSSEARAQVAAELTPEQRAVRLGHEALKLFAEQDFAAARERFIEADALAHSPVFVLYRARAEKKLGRLLLARSLVRKCAQEPIFDDSPDAWKKAVFEAVRELEALSAEIPSLRFVVLGGATYPIALKLGAGEFTLSEPETVLEVDPGAFSVTAADASGAVLSFDVFVASGVRARDVRLAFPSQKTVEHGEPKTPDPTNVDVVPGSRVRTYRSGAHAAFLLGGSALTVATVAMSLAVAKAKSVTQHCQGQVCRAEDQQKSQEAIRWANLATAGAVVGLVGAATGVGLLLLPRRGGGEVSIVASF